MPINLINKLALNNLSDTALLGSNVELSYGQLIDETNRLQVHLNLQQGGAPIALSLDNHPAWIIVDLASMVNNIPLVPLPLFFSDAQLLHAINDAGANTLITDTPSRFIALLGETITSQTTLTVANKKLTQLSLSTAKQNLQANTAKITYTSGTTGTPKGVCLGNQAMLSVANSIKTAAQLSAKDQHLCVLPLSTLLENVAGVYAALLAGATVHVLPSAHVGFHGSSFNIQQLLNACSVTKASTAILIPQLLNALVIACEVGVKLSNLRFLAVGGAHVSPQLLQRAAQLKLPVFEGYGLSESASVVALNTAQANKRGSVGKPLPHVTITFSDDHEILVKGANLLGYTHNTTIDSEQGFIKTGDIGFCDDDGYLFITGRKKNIFITSFGRNVSPEWVEQALLNNPEIAQTCLFGEARPWNIAVIVPAENASFAQIEHAINQTNQGLPDYARVTEWLPANAPFTVQNQQLTSNGRLKRDVIWQQYQEQINAQYTETTH